MKIKIIKVPRQPNIGAYDGFLDATEKFFPLGGPLVDSYCGGGKLFAIGGDLQTNGADFSTGLVRINAGKSHEQNPNDGVQMGVDSNGTPNLVEENETIFNNYVYSNRIYADGGTLQKFHLPRKAKLTFAEISKKLEKESAERPNDPISAAALKIQMEKLADEQERQKAEMEAKRAKEAFEALSPEEKVAVMNSAAQQEAMAQQQAIQEQEAMQQPSQEEMFMAQQQQQMADGSIPNVGAAPQMNAYGGKINRFDTGGVKGNWYDNLLSPYQWLAIMHQLQNEDAFNAMPGSYREGLKALSELASSPEYSNSTIADIYNNVAGLDTDIYNAISNRGLGRNALSSITPEQWQEIYNDYMTGYNDFTQRYPEIPYSMRNDEGYKEQWSASNSIPTSTNITINPIAPAASVQAPTSFPRYRDVTMESIEVPATPIPMKDMQEGVTNTENTSNTSDQREVSINPYAYSNNWDGFDYFNPKTDAYDKGYMNFVNNINQDWVDRIMKGQYGNMDRYLDKNKGISPTVEQVRTLASDKKYSDMHKAMAAAYKEYLAGIDPKTGQSAASVVTTPSPAPTGDVAGTSAPSPAVTSNEIVYHAIEGDEDYLEGDPSTWNVGPESGRVATFKNDAGEDVRVIYHNPASSNVFTEEELAKQDNNGVIPRHRPEWMRYAGLFGPAVGLGLMGLGVGRPDYSGLNAAIAVGNTGLARANYQPIGNYLAYRPLDIWAAQNRMDANSRATDRNIMNTSGGNRGAAMAGLVANGYNSQLGSGQLFRQSQEYNDALRKQVEEFNRGTDMFNAEAYTRNSQFNADAANRNRQFNAQLQMEAARQKMAADAGWYNSLYGNISGLFKGIGDLGTENYRMNRISEMTADGIFGNPGSSYTPSRHIKKSKGGKLKKRGMTY